MVHLSMTNVPHDIEWLSGSHANTTITIILIWILEEMNIYDNYEAQSNKLFITFCFIEDGIRMLCAIDIYIFSIFCISRKNRCQTQQLSKGYCTNNEVSHITYFDWFFVERF